MSTRKPKPEDDAIAPVTEAEAVEPAIATATNYEYQQGKCPVCGEKRLTNDANQLICPIQDKECPRNGV